MSRGNKVVLTYAPQTDVAVKPVTGVENFAKKIGQPKPYRRADRQRNDKR